MLVAAQYSKTQRREVTTYYVSTRERGALHCSIQQAIDKAEPFSRIVIAAGQYFEQITVTQPVELVGEDGDSPEICSRGVCVTVAGDVECLFENLNIVSKAPAPRTIFSRDLHAAVRIIKGKPTFAKCRMTSVYVGGHSYPCIHNCTITGNIAGCGLVVAEDADGEYLQNAITNHIPYCVLVKSRGTPVFSENTIYQEPKIIQAMLTSAPQLPRGGGAVLISPDGGNVDGDKSISPKFVNNRIGDEVIPTSISLSALARWYPRLASRAAANSSNNNGRAGTAASKASRGDIGGINFGASARGDRVGAAQPSNSPRGDRQKGRRGSPMRGTISTNNRIRGAASASSPPVGGGSPTDMSSLNTINGGGSRGTSPLRRTSAASAGGGLHVGYAHSHAALLANEHSHAALAERETALQSQLCERETVRVDFGCSPLFDDNHITGGHVSVSVRMGGAGVFTSNNISHGSLFGVHLHPLSSTVLKNNVVTQCATGLLLAASNASLVGNTVSDCAGAGCVLLTTPKARCFVSSNSFVANDIGLIAHEMAKPPKGMGAAGDGKGVTMSLPLTEKEREAEAAKTAANKTTSINGGSSVPPSPQQSSLGGASSSAGTSATTSPSKGGVRSEKDGGKGGENEKKNNEDGEDNSADPSAHFTTSAIAKGMISLNKSCGALLAGSHLDLALEDVAIGANGPLGVVVALSAAPTITRCHFDRGPIGLLICENGNPSVAECRFESHSEAAVCVENHGRGTVRASDFRSFSRAGVRITDAGQPLVTDNNFTALEGIGVEVSAGGIGAIVSNTFNTLFRGVVVSLFGDPLIQNNKVRAASDVGILVHNEGCGTIIGNRVAECAVGIASLTGGEATVRANAVTQSGKWGIYCGEGSLSLIEKNRVDGSFNANVMIEGAENRSVVRGNTLEGSRNAGIRLSNGATATITKNTTSNDCVMGILSEGGDACTVTRNTVEGCLGNGIAVGEGGGSTFEDNEVHNGSHNGFYLAAGGAATIKRCTTRDNAGSGLVVEQGSGGTFTECSIHDNARYGVEFVPSAAASAAAEAASAGGAATAAINGAATNNHRHRSDPSNAAIHGVKNEPKDLLAQSFSRKLQQFINTQKSAEAAAAGGAQPHHRSNSIVSGGSSTAAALARAAAGALAALSRLDIYGNKAAGIYVGSGCVGRASQCTIRDHSISALNTHSYRAGGEAASGTDDGAPSTSSPTSPTNRRRGQKQFSVPRIRPPTILWENMPPLVWKDANDADSGTDSDDGRYDELSSLLAAERRRGAYGGPQRSRDRSSAATHWGRRSRHRSSMLSIDDGDDEEGSDALVGSKRFGTLRLAVGAAPPAKAGGGGNSDGAEGLLVRRHQQKAQQKQSLNGAAALPIVSADTDQKWRVAIYCADSRPETRFTECTIADNDVGVYAGAGAEGCAAGSALYRNAFADVVFASESDFTVDACAFGRAPPPPPTLPPKGAVSALAPAAGGLHVARPPALGIGGRRLTGTTVATTMAIAAATLVPIVAVGAYSSTSIGAAEGTIEGGQSLAPPKGAGRGAPSGAAVVAVGSSAGRVTGCAIVGPVATAAVIITGESTVEINGTKVAVPPPPIIKAIGPLHQRLSVSSNPNAAAIRSSISAQITSGGGGMGEIGSAAAAAAALLHLSPEAPSPPPPHLLGWVGLICDGTSAPTIADCGFTLAERANAIIGRTTKARVEGSALSRSTHGVGAAILGPHCSLVGNTIADNAKEGIAYASAALPRGGEDTAAAEKDLDPQQHSPKAPDGGRSAAISSRAASSRALSYAATAAGGGDETAQKGQQQKPKYPSAASLGQTEHVRGNTISGNGGRGGVVCTPFSVGAIAANTITGNAVCGVRLLEESETVIEGNTVSNNAKCGVIIAPAARPTVRDNTIASNAVANVLLEEEAEGALIANTIKGGQKDGVYCRQQAATDVAGNTVEEHESGSGLVIDGPSPQLRIHNNSVCANHVGLGTVPRSGAAAHVEANSFSHNTICGAVLEEGSEVALTNNVFDLASCCVQLRTRAGGTVRGNSFLRSNEAIAIYGALVATDCQDNIFSGNSVGFALRGADSSYVLQNNSFGPHEVAAVLVEGRSSAIVANNTFWGANAPPQPSSSSAASGSGGRASSPSAAGSGGNHPSPPPTFIGGAGGNIAAAVAATSAAAAATARGILVRDTSRPWIRGNTFSGVPVGVEIKGASCVIDGCLFARCGAGVIVNGEAVYDRPMPPLSPRPSAGANDSLVFGIAKSPSPPSSPASPSRPQTSPRVGSGGGDKSQAPQTTAVCLTGRLLIVDSVFSASTRAGIAFMYDPKNCSTRRGWGWGARDQRRDSASASSALLLGYGGAGALNVSADDDAGAAILLGGSPDERRDDAVGPLLSADICITRNIFVSHAAPHHSQQQPAGGASASSEEKTARGGLPITAGIVCEPHSPPFTAEENCFSENTVAVSAAERTAPILSRNLFCDNGIAVHCVGERCRPTVKECALIGSAICGVLSTEGAGPIVSRSLFREGAGPDPQSAATASAAASLEMSSLKPSAVGGAVFCLSGGGTVEDCLFRCCSAAVVADGAHGLSIDGCRVVGGGCGILARGRPSAATHLSNTAVTGAEVGIAVAGGGMLSSVRGCHVSDCDFGLVGLEGGQCDDVAASTFARCSRAGVLLRGIGRYELKECLVAECSGTGVIINNKAPTPSLQRCTDPFGAGFPAHTLSVAVRAAAERLRFTFVAAPQHSPLPSTPQQQEGGGGRATMAELIHGVSTQAQQQQHHSVAFATIAPDTYKIALEETVRRSPFAFCRYVALLDRCQVRDNRVGVSALGGYASLVNNLIYGNEAGLVVGGPSSQAFALAMVKNACFESLKAGAVMHVYSAASQLSASGNQFYSPREGALEVFAALGQPEPSRQLSGNDTLNNCAYKQHIPPLLGTPIATDSDRLMDRHSAARCDDVVAALAPLAVALYVQVPQAQRDALRSAAASPAKASDKPSSGHHGRQQPQRHGGGGGGATLSTFYCPRLVSSAASRAPAIPRGRAEVDKALPPTRGQPSYAAMPLAPPPLAIAHPRPFGGDTPQAQPLPRGLDPQLLSSSAQPRPPATPKKATTPRASSTSAAGEKGGSRRTAASAREPQSVAATPNRAALTPAGTSLTPQLPPISPRKPSQQTSTSKSPRTGKGSKAGRRVTK